MSLIKISRKCDLHYSCAALSYCSQYKESSLLCYNLPVNHDKRRVTKNIWSNYKNDISRKTESLTFDATDLARVIIENTIRGCYG